MYVLEIQRHSFFDHVKKNYQRLINLWGQDAIILHFVIVHYQTLMSAIKRDNHNHQIFSSLITCCSKNAILTTVVYVIENERVMAPTAVMHCYKSIPQPLNMSISHCLDSSPSTPVRLRILSLIISVT